MDSRVPKTLLVSLTVHFFGVSAIILARSYIDLIFLSTYPASLLPYLFLGQTLVALVLTIGLVGLLARGTPKIQVSMLIFGALVPLGVTFSLPADTPGLSFGISLWLSALATLVGVLSWSAVGEAFDIRNFKKAAKWVGAAGSVGALIAGFAIPPIVARIASEAVLVTMTLCVAASAIGLLGLKRHTSPSRKKAKSGRGNPIRFPLFRWVAIGVGILLFVDVLTDYILKRELSIQFDKAGIAAFMGPFYGLSSAVTLIVQFAVTDRLLKRFGVAGLLMATPIMCLIGVGTVLLFPGLYGGALLRFVEGVGYYGLYSVGREIADTPLPASTRRTSKLFMKGVVSPLGSGAAALFLFFVKDGDTRLVVGAIAVFSLFWLYDTYKIKLAYQSTLAEAVRTMRFGLSYALPESGGPVSLKDLHGYAIRATDEQTVIMGLNLLAQEASGPLPKAAIARLTDPNGRVRRAVADTAYALGDVAAVPLLLKQYRAEQDSDVAWHLLRAVANLAPEAGIDIALAASNHPVARVRAGAVLILLCSADLDSLIVAAPALKEMLAHQSHEMRAAAADVISGLQGSLQKELIPLLKDPNDSVRMAAVRACRAEAPQEVVVLLAQMTGAGVVSRLAGVALMQMKEKGLEPLVNVVRYGRIASKRAAMRIIGYLPCKHSETLLANLGNNPQLEIANSAAEEAARRAHRQGADNLFRTSARNLALRESEKVAALSTVASCESLGNKVRIEVVARWRLALNQFLHWFAVATSPKAVLEAIPSVLPPIRGQLDPNRRAAAVELLDAIADDAELRSALSRALETNLSPTPDIAISQLKTVADPWLDRLLVVHSGAPIPEGTMDLFDRATLLRKVDLFEALPGEVLLSIAEMTEPIEVFVGDILFKKDDAPNAFYIVASGRVEIIKEEKSLASLEAPHYFGELGLLDDSPRLADARVIADGLLMRIEKENFYQITEDLPEVLRAIIRKLLQYVRGTNGGEYE